MKMSSDEKSIRARIEAMPGGYSEIDQRIELLRAVCYAKRTVDPGRYACKTGTLMRSLNVGQQKDLFDRKIRKLFPVWERLHPGQARDPEWLPFQAAYEVDGHLVPFHSLEELVEEGDDDHPPIARSKTW